MDAGAAAATGAGALTISAAADHGSAAAGSARECALCQLVGGGRHKGGRGLDGTALLLLLLLLLVLVLLALVALLVVRVDALAAQVSSLLQEQQAQGG